MGVTGKSARSGPRNYNLIFRRLHKWLALIVGIQLVLWTLSGFLMSYVPIEEVHGDHLWHKTARPTAVNAAEVSFGVNDLMARYKGRDVIALRLFSRNGQAAYEVAFADETILLDARNGELLSPVTENQAVAIARKAYRWTGQYLSVEYVTDPEQYGEIRGKPLPVWKVNFDDDVASSLYVSPASGQIVTVRSDIWRQFDFFWMLHIMDYDERQDFNSLLLIFAASLGLFTSLSGVFLIFYAFSKRDFRWIRK